MGAPANGVYSFLGTSFSIIGPGVSLIVTGAAREGYTVAMDNDKSSFQSGADGSGMHSLMASQAGKITIRALKTSAINRAMNTLYRYQTGSPALHGQNVFSIKHNFTGDTISAAGGAIVKHSNIGYDTEGPANEWVFQFTYIDIVLGDGGVTNLVVNGG